MRQPEGGRSLLQTLRKLRKVFVHIGVERTKQKIRPSLLLQQGAPYTVAVAWLWGDDERLLSSLEENFIRNVFRTTVLPRMSRIRIRNGLSPTGTAITTPRNQTQLVGSRIQSSDDYLIMVGQRLFDGDLSRDHPSTLVHEMVHVWQYMHGTLTQAGALAAHVGYYVAEEVTRPVQLPGRPARDPLVKQEDLYRYHIGESWNDMGFEGQAQMVEEWYLENMDETGDRWTYVKQVLMLNDRAARSLTLAELNTRFLDLATDHPPSRPDRAVAQETVTFSDNYLLRVLQQPIGPNDVQAMAARVKTWEAYCRQFRKLQQSNAVALAGRLDAKKPGDKLAQAFQYHLSTPTRDRLLKILRGLA